jgi:hypothetical protein
LFFFPHFSFLLVLHYFNSMNMQTTKYLDLVDDQIPDAAAAPRKRRPIKSRREGVILLHGGSIQVSDHLWIRRSADPSRHVPGSVHDLEGQEEVQKLEQGQSLPCNNTKHSETAPAFFRSLCT